MRLREYACYLLFVLCGFLLSGCFVAGDCDDIVAGNDYHGIQKSLPAMEKAAISFMDKHPGIMVRIRTTGRSDYEMVEAAYRKACDSWNTDGARKDTLIFILISPYHWDGYDYLYLGRQIFVALENDLPVIKAIYSRYAKNNDHAGGAGATLDALSARLVAQNFQAAATSPAKPALQVPPSPTQPHVAAESSSREDSWSFFWWAIPCFIIIVVLAIKLELSSTEARPSRGADIKLCSRSACAAMLLDLENDVVLAIAAKHNNAYKAHALYQQAAIGFASGGHVTNVMADVERARKLLAEDLS